MENMDMSLISLMDSRNKVPFPVDTLRLILYQVLAGLKHIHQSGFFHRDIKPENILVSKVPVQASHLFKLARARRYQFAQHGYSYPYYSINIPSHCSHYQHPQQHYETHENLSNGSSFSFTVSASTRVALLDDSQEDLPGESETYIVKLADFGLARHIDCPDPYTSYVSTRWYRAPELLLRRGVYSCPIDVWAFGTMATEISNLKPLFPGSNEPDQIIKQVNILGQPGPSSLAGTWHSMPQLAKKVRITYPKTEVCLISLISTNCK